MCDIILGTIHVGLIMEDEMNQKALEEKSIELLKKLIQFKTINPPGACLECIKYLESVCSDEGIDNEIHVLPNERGVFTATIKGSDTSLEPIILLSHIDVVPANEDGWVASPFSAEEKDGFIYGRGALDMKCLTAMELASLIYIKRNNIIPKRDIILVAHGDEETEGEYGAKWYCENHLSVRKPYAILNEGVYGMKDVLFKGSLFPIEVGQKFGIKVRLTAKMNSGLGSIPENNYSTKNLVTALNKVLNYKPSIDIKNEINEYFKCIAKYKKFPESLILKNLDKKVFLNIFDKIASTNALLNAHIRTTIALTQMDGGSSDAHGVVPSEASAVLDVRMLPETDYIKTFEKIKEIVDDDNIEVEIIKQPFVSKTSNFNTDPYRVLKESIQNEFPGAEIVPYISIGASDSRYFRNQGIDCYGIIPVLLDDYSDIIHCANERVSIENMRRATRVVANFASMVSGGICSN